MLTIRQTLLSILTCFVTAGMALPVHAQLGASDAAELYKTENTYTITRKGKKIGTHSLTFSTSGNTLTVQAKSDIKVTALKIPVFRFNYLSTEIWQDDQLISVESTAKTGKKTERSSLLNESSTSQISYNGKQTTAERIAYATNHWNINAVTESTVFNTIKGAASQIVVKEHGRKTLNINDKTLTTTHYEYTGDIQAQTWYDDNNRWVKLLFLGSDGSEITYTIDTP